MKVPTAKILLRSRYNPDRVVLGKTMAEHLRFAVCVLGILFAGKACGFGEASFQRPWLQSHDMQERARLRVDAMFELI